MQLAADVAQAFDEGALDVRVNVFQLYREGKLPAVDLTAEGQYEPIADLTTITAS